MSTDTLRTRQATRSRPAVRRRFAALQTSSKWIFLGIGLVAALIPFIWMISGSFRSEADLFGNPSSLFPTSITLHGYIGIWQQLPFLRLVFNSFIFAGVTTAATLLFDSMTA